MDHPLHDPKVLLVGRGLLRVDLLIEAFDKVGAEVLFADDPIHALKMLRFEVPQLVIFDNALPAEETSVICRSIRANPRLSNTPVVFAGHAKKGFDAVRHAIDAGADDYVSDLSNTDNFLARLVWMMEQRSDALAQRSEYESVRLRHMQTLEIVKETSELFNELAAADSSDSHDIADQRIELGLGMISGLAKILEEQIETVDRLFDRQPLFDLSSVDPGEAFDPDIIDGGCDLGLPM